MEQIGELGKDGEYQSAAVILIGFAIRKKMGQIKAWYIKLIDLLKKKSQKNVYSGIQSNSKKKIPVFAVNALH